MYIPVWVESFVLKSLATKRKRPRGYERVIPDGYKYILLIFALIFTISVYASDEGAGLSTEDKEVIRPSQITWDHVEGLLNMLGLQLTEKERLRESRTFAKQQVIDHRIIQKLNATKNRTFLGTAGHQLKGFGPEAAIFYAAIGANMFIQSQADSIMKDGRSDPIWMENLLYEATSPVGLFSFFCFVMASGQVNLLYSRWLSPGLNLTFKKGPLKGRQIIKVSPLFSPEILNERLGELRLQATLERVGNRKGIPGASAGVKYQVARFQPRFGLFLAGPLGMSAGMMASNIVHELDYVFSYNPHFSPCMDEIWGRETTMNKENGRLHCDLFWDGMASTIVSWAPGLASLVTASILSHAAVNAAYGLAGRVVKGGQYLGARSTQVSQNVLQNWAKRAGVRVPWSRLARAAALVPTPATTGVKVGAKGVWALIKSIASGVKRHILPPGMKMVQGKMVPSGGIGFRFINLLAFMLTDTWITHGFYNAIWTETIKSRDVSDGMEDLITYSNVDSDTPAKVCESDDESDCKYHDSILSAHKTALTFDRWRQFRMQMAMMAHHNWFKYVSSTTGPFEQIYNMYRLLFQAKNSRNAFHTVNYFGGVSDEGLFSEEVQLSEEGTAEGPARFVFEEMIKQIDEHLNTQDTLPSAGILAWISSALFGNDGTSTPSDVAVDLVSVSPSHFLKPGTDVGIDDKDRLFVLRSLFSVVDPNVPFERFYGDEWVEALQQEEKSIYQYENPNRIAENHFATLEQETQDLKNMTLRSISEGGLRKVALALAVNTNECEGVDATDCVSEAQVTQGIVNIIWNSVGNYVTELDKAVKSLPQKIKGMPIHSSTKTKLSEYAGDINEKSREIYGTSLEVVAEKAGLGLGDLDADSFVRYLEDFVVSYFDEWIDWIQSERGKILQEISIDSVAVTEMAENRLRKKVLSAGLEYLSNIIELEKTERRRGPSYVSSSLWDKKEELPQELLSVYYVLGMDNIFAQLYAKTFVEQEQQETTDRSYLQMKPKAPGMHIVETGNEIYKIKTEAHEIKYHPGRLQMVNTPGFMDFLIASAVCGPDPKEVKELTDEQEGHLLDTSFEGFMDSVPVFGSFISGIDEIAGKGSSYAFYPPRITTLDEKTRSAICRGAYAKNGGIVENLYDGYFPVGDKVYSNLVHLVFDHIGFNDGETEIASVEDFDRWWSVKINPYMGLFTKAADQEYKRIVQHDFMGPLFMEDVEKVSMVSFLGTDALSEDSEWDIISDLSKIWFKKHSYGRYPPQVLDERDDTLKRFAAYDVNLPKGVFQNMHFEVLYWSDMILHFAKKKDISDNRMANLKEGLKLFAEEFNISQCVVDTECDYIAWANRFLEKGGILKSMRNLLKVNIGGGEALDIHVESLESQANPDADPHISSLSFEEQEERRKQAIAAFACDSDDCDLPRQILNFALIRLTQILREATNYANQVGYISKHPDVQTVNTPAL